MKKVLKLTLVTVALVCSTSLFAQKFGYINRSELIMAMPERDSAEKKLVAFSNDLQGQLEAIQVEFNNKYQEFQKSLPTLSESVRSLKEKELSDLQTRFEEFQMVARQDLQKMEETLMAPIVKKADEAIAKVSKSSSLLAVFDTSAGATAYIDEAAMTNVLPVAKRELGITK